MGEELGDRPGEGVDASREGAASLDANEQHPITHDQLGHRMSERVPGLDPPGESVDACDGSVVGIGHP